MTTVADVLNESFKKSGVLGLGQAMDGGDMVSGLADFNDMIAQWNTQRWMTWDLLTLGYVSTGANSYTVGPAGNFSVAVRPDRIESAFQRQLIASGLNVDTPLEVIPSREEYNRLSLKGLVSFGQYVFLDSSYPTATLYLYPIPNASIYEIFISIKNAIPFYTIQNIGTALSIPPQYIAALKFNLAKRFRQAYGKGLRPDMELNALARSSLDIVKQSNLQIPELVMPNALIKSSGYNILSDQFGSSY
jgi:hypothetical protein